jgi:hypothetical protein
MQTETDPGELYRRFRSLVTTHAKLHAKEAAGLRTIWAELLDRFLAERKKWAESQLQSADDFNLLEVLEVEGDEVTHSKILAWLLDHRIESGTHAQGNLGFRLFLKELRREFGEVHYRQLEAYAHDLDYWVRRELAGEEARVDIEIAARGKFLIHIENKIHSAEGEDQTDREWRDVKKRRGELSVPKGECHAVFLTLEGARAKNCNFRPLKWRRIANVFDAFAKLAQPPEVRLFASHVAKAIRKLSAVAPDESEDQDAEIQ